MAEMSSFYGGRQGNSIVIAKRFDGINIPQSAGKYTYTRGLYAIDKNGDFIITQDKTISGIIGVGILGSSGDYEHSTTDFLIKKNKDNYLGDGIEGFVDWGGHDNDGSLISEDLDYVFCPELAQGMVQFFAEGAKTASEVNYGAYVIIDTLLNMSAIGDPDNGKVFRRGMDINSTDGFAGAEYIGQIVGPKGDSPELDLDSYANVTALEKHREASYNAGNESIVPGSYTIGENRYYEDEIHYAWATMRDAFGNIIGCKIGFNFPTLIQDFEARSLSPYVNRAKDIEGKYYNYDLLSPDESQYTTMIKTFAVDENGAFLLCEEGDKGAYKVTAAEGEIYLIEKTDETETYYTEWQLVNFTGLDKIITSDDNEYTIPEIKKWSHPFYQKWKVSIPQGYHGIGSENIEVIHTYTKTPKYKGDTVTLYNTAECSEDNIYKIITNPNETYRLYGTEYKLITSIDDLDEDDTDAREHLERVGGRYYIRYGAGYESDISVPYARIKLAEGVFKYVKKSDCYMDIIRYQEVDYDDKEEGVKRYFFLGDYDIIDRVTISSNGILTVFYSAKAEPEELEQIIRWIDTDNTDGITIDEDGTIHVYYNTLDSDGKHEHQDYKNVLDWITEASLSQSGDFSIIYNNDTVKVGYTEDGQPIYGNKYETKLHWIDYIDFAEDGTVTFRWNTDTSRQGAPAYQFKNKIKYLSDISIQTAKDSSSTTGNQYEGTGDQRVHVKYNNDGQVDHAIGNPLNYIIEACISAPTASYPNAPYSHLLVYYSDPELRAKYSSKWVTYPSTKVIDSYVTDQETGEQTPIYHTWTEWVDMGNIRGDAGGLHIIKNVSSLDDLKDSAGKFIPPEQLTDENGELIMPNGAGWGCSMDIAGDSDTKEILFYDYDLEEWYSIGRIDPSSIDPRYFIVKSAPESGQTPTSKDVSNLKTYGFWFAAETAYYAY